MSRHSYSPHESWEKNIPKDQKAVAIEYMRKGYLAANPNTDNPELKIEHLLISEGLMDPQVGDLPMDISAIALLKIVTDRFASFGLFEWEVNIRCRVDASEIESNRHRGINKPLHETVYNNYIIECKRNETSTIRAHEDTPSKAVMAVQKSVSRLYSRHII